MNQRQSIADLAAVVCDIDKARNVLGTFAAELAAPKGLPEAPLLVAARAVLATHAPDQPNAAAAELRAIAEEMRRLHTTNLGQGLTLDQFADRLTAVAAQLEG